jgi:osmoprotectant transport system ATP-binding protein
MLRLDHVSRCFGATVAVDDVSLEVEEGSTTVLIGPSGCGKSTLLRLMNGLLWPDRGTVSIGGDRLRSDNVEAVRRRIGYVIQDGGLFPHLTARENIILMARWLGIDPGERERRVTELAELTHFPPAGLDRYPSEISGGQAQRVALMRALMLDPELLLLDEPLGALDPMVRARLQEELREIFRRLHKSVVLVTHDLAEAIFFADTVVLMRDGRIVQRGGPRDLIAAPADAFVEEFVGAQRPVDWPGGAA